MSTTVARVLREGGRVLPYDVFMSIRIAERARGIRRAERRSDLTKTRARVRKALIGYDQELRGKSLTRERRTQLEELAKVARLRLKT